MNWTRVSTLASPLIVVFAMGVYVPKAHALPTLSISSPTNNQDVNPNETLMVKGNVSNAPSGSRVKVELYVQDVNGDPTGDSITDDIGDVDAMSGDWSANIDLPTQSPNTTKKYVIKAILYNNGNVIPANNSPALIKFTSSLPGGCGCMGPE